ncbi:hypothetical protein NGRA_3046 [Nosema granulosis]|uniref:Uncharacterized protein n=1 Tax=Nosema granulosis TaxID=83296 RepID=A0A9P6GY62_9MICR|nr:hypothetical protein NGRA_3046 [Nosema granulosis]
MNLFLLFNLIYSAHTTVPYFFTEKEMELAIYTLYAELSSSEIQNDTLVFQNKDSNFCDFFVELNATHYILRARSFSKPKKIHYYLGKAISITNYEFIIRSISDKIKQFSSRNIPAVYFTIYLHTDSFFLMCPKQNSVIGLLENQFRRNFSVISPVRYYPFDLNEFFLKNLSKVENTGRCILYSNSICTKVYFFKKNFEEYILKKIQHNFSVFYKKNLKNTSQEHSVNGLEDEGIYDSFIIYVFRQLGTLKASQIEEYMTSEQYYGFLSPLILLITRETFSNIVFIKISKISAEELNEILKLGKIINKKFEKSCDDKYFKLGKKLSEELCERVTAAIKWILIGIALKEEKYCTEMCYFMERVFSIILEDVKIFSNVLKNTTGSQTFYEFKQATFYLLHYKSNNFLKSWLDIFLSFLESKNEYDIFNSKNENLLELSENALHDYEEWRKQLMSLLSKENDPEPDEILPYDAIIYLYNLLREENTQPTNKPVE